MQTKAEVLGTHAGEGWFARYLDEPASEGVEATYTFEQIVAFLVLRHHTGRIEIVGFVQDDKGGFDRATKWTNFDGYAHG